MAIIYVPIISPFSMTGPLHEAGDSHIQSHHLAYEVAHLSRKLKVLIAQFDAEVSNVTQLQEQIKLSKNNNLATNLQKAEKLLLASRLPIEINLLKGRIAELKADLSDLAP